jgi:hypothetical protein
MAIRLHCDRCGKFVQAMGEPKDLAAFKKEVICKQCEASEKKLNQFAEGLKSKWLIQVDKLVLEAKKEIAEELEKIKASYEGKED